MVHDALMLLLTGDYVGGSFGGWTEEDHPLVTALLYWHPLVSGVLGVLAVVALVAALAVGLTVLVFGAAELATTPAEELAE